MVGGGNQRNDPSPHRALDNWKHILRQAYMSRQRRSRHSTLGEDDIDSSASQKRKGKGAKGEEKDALNSLTMSPASSRVFKQSLIKAKGRMTVEKPPSSDSSSDEDPEPAKKSGGFFTKIGKLFRGKARSKDSDTAAVRSVRLTTSSLMWAGFAGIALRARMAFFFNHLMDRLKHHNEHSFDSKVAAIYEEEKQERSALGSSIRQSLSEGGDRRDSRKPERQKSGNPGKEELKIDNEWHQHLALVHTPHSFMRTGVEVDADSGSDIRHVASTSSTLRGSFRNGSVTYQSVPGADILSATRAFCDSNGNVKRPSFDLRALL